MKEQEKIQLKREIKNQNIYQKNIQCSEKDRKDKRNVKLKNNNALLCI